MRFVEQRLPGVYIIEPQPFEDDRGMFRRHFCEREFREHDLAATVKQCNVSENMFKHTLRGFHYQIAPHGEGKTLTCFRGAVHDIVVDVRESSPTYLQWLAVELNDENRKSLHVPPGCANAFLTLTDRSLIHYYCSESYAPEAERGIRYNDPLFKFGWPHEPKVISAKDRRHQDFTR